MTPDLAAALVAALSDLTTVEKGRTANAGAYRYAYADLGDVVRVTRPALAAHGIAALTPVSELEGGRLAVTVTLVHSSGEELAFDPLPFPAGADAQATGSAMTYFRRYALLAALGMATDDDDAAGAKTAAPAAKATRDPLPAARKRLGQVVHNLDDDRRTALREWLAAEGLPDRPAKMTAEQCALVTAWLETPTTVEAWLGPSTGA